MLKYTELSKKITKRADQDNLPQDHELRKAATDFNTAYIGYFATPQTVTVAKFLGTWAKTRKLWCAYSGEELI